MDGEERSNMEGQKKSDLVTGTPGERLDQLLSNAKQLGGFASRKAKEIADVAAPKIKAFGGTAAEETQRMLNRKDLGGGIFRTLLDFYRKGGKVRKRVLIGAAAYILLMIVLLPFLIVDTPGHGVSQHSQKVFGADEYNQIAIAMTNEQVESLLGKPTVIIPETETRWGSSTWGNSATDAWVVMLSFRDGKVYSKSLINGEVARAEQAITDLGDKFAFGDQAMWKEARKVQSAGWQASDQVMQEASPEMHSAYQTWRSASIAFPTKYETGAASTTR